ncbi:hypothetical protein J132_10791, partial [Termitomyces sp. J132]
QQNINKLLTTQHAMLVAMNDNIDIICLQEPCYNFNKQSRATQKWRPVYPKNHKESKTSKLRTIMMVSKRITMDSWMQLNINSMDVIVINNYSQVIKDAKRRHWEEWLEQVDANSVWNAKKFMTAMLSDGGCTRVPVLNIKVEGRTREVEENGKKTKLFHKTFFYNKLKDCNIPADHQYPLPAFEWLPIPNKEIYATVAKLHPHKVPGLIGIPSVMIMKTRYMLVPYLRPVFRATFVLGAYPERWKIFQTVVLKKPGRNNYSNSNLYQLIALLNMIAKVLDEANLMEKHNILPKHQFGGCPE